MNSLMMRILNANVEDLPALTEEVEALTDETMKQDHINLLRDKEFTARSLFLTGPEDTETLKKEILDDSHLTQNQKATFSALVKAKVITLMKFGNFFTRIDELFVKDESFKLSQDEDDEYDFYKRCCRSGYSRGKRRRSDSDEVVQEKIMKSRTKNEQNPNDVYKITYDAALERGNEAATSGSRPSTHNSAGGILWPTNVLGEQRCNGMEIAHLVPPSTTNAFSYWFVADFLFGADSNCEWSGEDPNLKWSKISRLIHGSNALKGKKQRGLIIQVSNIWSPTKYC
mmetsp:Transcript_4416/g.11392  ORF Transcript_4416/g.11392 Transcript_4416/m.11392 type:complete len:285 (+) Transcript_4416:364-1218(+)